MSLEMFPWIAGGLLTVTLRPTNVYGSGGPRDPVGEMFPLIAFGLLVATYIGLMIARKIREDRDAERTEATGGRWRIRSQIPWPAPDPYQRFGFLRSAMILNTREGTDEGFGVAYFDNIVHSRSERCAIVDLPVEGPTLDPRTPVSERRAIGPQTSDVLASMAGMTVDSAPFTILVRSSQSADAVQQAALRLAHAIVADAKTFGVTAHRIDAPDAKFKGRQHQFL
jgi:hypothetical protein